ncbi:MAG: hypothetical protein LIR50_10260 [Bacillota bacterium]|nr:hypothetical protein [Bacillota bacterium]
MMNWKDKMKKAMKAIKEASGENASWDNCYHCPFLACCNAMGHEGLSAPDGWEIKNEDN